MKNYLFKTTLLIAVFVALIASSSSKISAEIVQVGNGAATSEFVPGNGYYCTAHWEYLLTPAMIEAAGGASGIISSLSVQHSVDAASGTIDSRMCIYLANVDFTALNGVIYYPATLPEMELVFHRASWSWNQQHAEQFGTSAPYAVGDWATFTLDNTFEYTGGALLIKFLHSQAGGWSTGTNSMYGTAYMADNATNTRFDGGFIQRACEEAPIDGGATNTNFLPNFRLDLAMNMRMMDFSPNDTLIGIPDRNNADLFVPSVAFAREATTDPAIQLQYIIRDPAGTVVWKATNPTGPASDWVDIPTNVIGTSSNPAIYRFPRATGTAADNSQTYSRINLRRGDIVTGEYKAEVKMRYIDGTDTIIQEEVGNVELRWNQNIEIDAIVYPEAGRWYPIVVDMQVPLHVSFRSTGVAPIKNFDIEYRVLKSDNLEEVYRNAIEVRLIDSLLPDALYDYEHNGFIPDSLNLPEGSYIFETTVVPIEMADYEIINKGTTIFHLQHNYNGIINAIVFPKSDSLIYPKQVYFPAVNVSNLAHAPAAATPITATITNIATGDIIYSAEEIIDNLASDNDSIEYVFKTPFILPDLASYLLTVTISTVNDKEPSNNSLTFALSAAANMAGSYTVGTGGTFETLEEAFNAIYSQGIEETGTIILELTEPVYNIGSISTPDKVGFQAGEPSQHAIEFTSAVPGATERNRIRIVPSAELAKTKSGVTINFTSSTGIGWYFGSSLSSPYIEAPINKMFFVSEASNLRPNDFYGFNVNIEIDGGVNKSIHFKMADNLPAEVSNRIPIMIGTGSKNITIKNCVIEGQPVADPEVPGVLYDAKFNTFTFNPIEKISAGVLIRNVIPVDENGYNSNRLDTILTSNITIDSNEFVGGSYGIISTGIGPLYNNEVGYYVGYYNINSRISNNKFYDMDIAGAFLGYEQSTSVEYNNFYNIGLNYNGGHDVAGIILGGYGKAFTDNRGTTGYNNFNIKMNGNEISKIYSNNSDAYGIKVEQTMNNFIYSHLVGDKYFTNHNDSIKLYNNVIWNIFTEGSNVEGSRYGIRLFGSRRFEPENDAFYAFTNRFDTALYVSHAHIINNTIRIEDDGINNGEEAYIGGLVLQDVDTLIMYNNAIALFDEDNLSDIVAPLVVQSIRPNTPNTYFDVDRNIYYAPDNLIVRFIEQSTRSASAIKEAGSRNQFNGLEQWRFVSKTELLSSINNFNIYLYETSGAPSHLSIRVPAPVGSPLNNKGKRFDFVTTDINKNTRGKSEQPYDIGAWEFEGRIYDNDLEVLGFVTPSAERNYAHPIFGEAEYIMTTMPISVSASVRNNGGNWAQGRNAMLSVYYVHTTITGTEVETLIAEYTQNFSVAPTETVVVDFSDAVNNGGLLPKTYKELEILSAPVAVKDVPSRFVLMRNNVTPIYRFKLTLLDKDQDNTNDVNLSDKSVRYYLKKSSVSAIASVEDADFVPAGDINNYVSYIESQYRQNNEWTVIPTEEERERIIGFENFLALYNGLDSLGLKAVPEDGSDFSYDLFNRSVWEPNSVNYADYKYMFWADAYSTIPLTEAQEADIKGFMAGTNKIKKAIIFSSEEIAKNARSYYLEIDEPDLIYDIFGTNPRGTGSYNPQTNEDTIQIIGTAILPNTQVKLINTPLYKTYGNVLSGAYNPALFEYYGNNNLSALQAFYYVRPASSDKINKSFGIISFNPNQTNIYLGADWRNYSDPSLVLQGLITYLGGLKGDNETGLAQELISFDANALNNKVLIDWQTAAEINLNKFTVEKQVQHLDSWEAIYDVDARKSNALANNYFTTDPDVSIGNTYTYRLKMLDVDGTINYSNPKTVTIDANTDFVTLKSPVPNPAKNDITVTFALSYETNVTLSIYDMSGKEVMTLVANETFAATEHNLDFSIKNLGAGSYNLVLNADGKASVQPFVVVK